MRGNNNIYIQNKLNTNMKTEILKKIGLTDGEIRVYTALIKLKKSSTGPIIDKSGISSSKVYIILEKLIQKGFVSFIVENNVKNYYATNPKNITHYIEKQEKELEQTKKDSKELVSDISKLMGSFEEESAQIYRGFAGMRVAFQNMLDDLPRGGELLFFFVSAYERTDRVILFMKNFNTKRLSKNIYYKDIVTIENKKEVEKTFTFIKDYKL